MASKQFSPLYLIFLYLIPSSFSTGFISKPGCPDRCGNLTIPFPFGVGSDCSLDLNFSITCNTSTAKAYLYNDLEVAEIIPSQIRLKFRRLLKSACYNSSAYDDSPPLEGPRGYVFTGTPYTISNENWITVIGCDDLVTVNVLNFPQGPGTIDRNCASSCENTDTDRFNGVGFCPDDGTVSTSHEGCCTTPVPTGTTEMSIQLNDTTEELQRRSYSCGYAFLQEQVPSNQSKFSYPLSFLGDPKVFLDDKWQWEKRAPPVVRLDWRIDGSKNCSDARKNTTTYACRSPHSVCVDSDGYATNGGYFCQCKEGYGGNPYLSDGCQDIEDCADSKPNPCSSNSVCFNIEGSFNCQCQKWYSGDGRKSGSGCTQSKRMTIFIGIASGMGALAVLSACVLLLKELQKRTARMRKAKFFKQNGGLILQQRRNEGTIGKTQLFLVEELEKATDNFNKSRILGQGGQGIVYKGMLSDGMLVAIKKSNVVDKAKLKQFINEVVILSQINHRNVVRLLGCCLETEVPLLVYEFLPNGTLSDLIHDSRIEFPISWSMRLKMAADIAGALAYLHSATSTPIYHRDIKSSNILLDEKHVVKVSDFGISRNVSMDRTHLTTQVQGTFGYFDPEYFQSNQFTEKSDVYSFGVVLAELLTGQKPISSKEDEEEKSLVTRFLAAIEDNKLDIILDPQVTEQGLTEVVNAVALLARRCLNMQGRMRPTMKEVAVELESLRFSQMPTTLTHESEEAVVYESSNTMSSDMEYRWTTSDISPLSTSETHPLKFQTL